MKQSTLRELKPFFILWFTQSLSSLGSAMTSFALVVWSYQQEGSALTTSMLTICSYAPYVLMSIFAGALSDKWNKKVTMLISDSFAALCTVWVLVLLKTGNLQIWHLYLNNALNGLMNTVQQPASDVAITLLTPKKFYQKVSGLRSFSNSLITILTPAAASSVLSFWGMDAVIAIDLLTFLIAFLALLFLVPIPHKEQKGDREALFASAKAGLIFLLENRGILDLILFLAAINFTASAYNAALPAMLLSRQNGGESVLGLVNTCSGIATLAGSVVVSLLPAPKSRVRVICNTLLFSMSTENFMLAFGRTPLVWCTGAVLGWLLIPVMNANMDVIFRNRIPVEMQGRVYAARNTLQFFTIPIGYLTGGFLIDYILEPFMAVQPESGLLYAAFGSGKGTGAAFLYFIIAFIGIMTCLIFRKDKHLWSLERKEQGSC